MKKPLGALLGLCALGLSTSLLSAQQFPVAPASRVAPIAEAPVAPPQVILPGYPAGKIGDIAAQGPQPLERTVVGEAAPKTPEPTVPALPRPPEAEQKSAPLNRPDGADNAVAGSAPKAPVVISNAPTYGSEKSFPLAPPETDRVGVNAPPVAAAASEVPLPQATESSRGGFITGAGLYYFRPLFSANPAYVSTSNQTVGNPNTTQTQTREFSWDYHVSPRAWVGYVCENGWGSMFSYWQFRADSGTVSIDHPADPPGIQTFGSTLGALPIPVRSNFPPIPNDTITVNSSLSLSVYDLEVALIGGSDRVSYKATFGARYAHIRQSYTASLVNPGNPPNFFQTDTSTFSGGGPTMSGEIDYRIYRRISLYGTGRFSLLYGSSHEDASQLQSGINPNVAFASNHSKDLLMPVGEIELGVAWQTNWKRFQFVAKGGFAAQMWWDAGSASIPAGGSFSSLGAQTP